MCLNTRFDAPVPFIGLNLGMARSEICLRRRAEMVKWRSAWVKIVYVGITLMTLAVASGAGHFWD